ncbi:MAG: 1-acyl-sn-glycerol-3-phosphate acyltransferase [Bdellovibrio sp.]|nr:1-acyl-sn-glycerol-3-phosphate acyltransferase [Bdellovibrio sp.]
MVYFVKIVIIAIWFFVGCALGVIKIFFKGLTTTTSHEVGYMIGSVALKIAGIKLKIAGIENLEKIKPCIYIGNHQSAFDAIVFAYLFPKKTIVIGKKEIRWIPFFGLLFKATGNIMIDRKNREDSVSGLNQAVRAIQEKKYSVIIFPEGTRNKEAEIELLPFKKGAFHMAIQTRVPLIPIVCANIKPLVSWREKKLNSGTLEVSVLAPIFVTQTDTADDLLNRCRESMQKEFINLKTEVK